MDTENGPEREEIHLFHNILHFALNSDELGSEMKFDTGEEFGKPFGRKTNTYWEPELEPFCRRNWSRALKKTREYNGIEDGNKRKQ